MGVLLVFKSVFILDALKARLNEVLLFELFDGDNLNDALLFRLVSLYFPMTNLFFFCLGTSLSVETVFRNFRLPDNLLVAVSADSSSLKYGITQQKRIRRIQMNPRIVMATMKPASLESLLEVLLSKLDKIKK